MAWFRRTRKPETETEQRAIGGLGWLPENYPTVPFGSGGPAHPSQSVVGVDHALSLAPVYAASKLLADGVASLPLRVYRPDGNGAPVRWTGPSIFHSKPETALGPMGQGPSVTGTLYDWLFALMTSLTLQGNAFGLVTTRDAFQYPLTIEWMPAHRVEVNENDIGLPNPGRAEYFFDGRHVRKEDVFHIRAFTVPGRTRGISPLRAFAGLVAQGLAMQDYGSAWFASGGFPLGIMKNTVQEIDDEQSAEIKSRVVSALRRRQPLVMGSDWDFQAVSVPPEEAQFVVSQQLNATMIGAAFGVPPYKIGGTRGDSMTYSNVESEQISFVTESLRPWLSRLEQAFYGILPGERYARFDVDDMIRADSKTKREIYAIDRANGIRTVDEIRQLEDMPPLAGGAGHDEMPLTLVDALGRAGVAVPTNYLKDLTILNVPAGADPAEAATGDGDEGKAVPPAPPKRKGPAQVPAARGEARFSLGDVARDWAGNKPASPEKLRPYLAETGLQARRHGVVFRNYAEPCLDELQRDWLLGFMRGAGEPAPAKAIPAGNGKAH